MQSSRVHRALWPHDNLRMSSYVVACVVPRAVGERKCTAIYRVYKKKGNQTLTYCSVLNM